VAYLQHHPNHHAQTLPSRHQIVNIVTPGRLICHQAQRRSEAVVSSLCVQRLLRVVEIGIEKGIVRFGSLLVVVVEVIGSVLLFRGVVSL